MPTLLSFFPDDFDGTEHRFFEPFVGGGALSIALGDPTRTNYVPGENLYINDTNPDLILAYEAIRDRLSELTRCLDAMAVRKDRVEYELVRESDPTDKIERAARFIYLNKTCFNGLWRVNAKGVFNVPFGRLRNPTIYDEKNLKALSARLHGASVTRDDFTAAVSCARRGDLIYFDPPYIPLTLTSSFSQYAKEGFSVADQRRLATLVKDLTEKGVRVVLSNSSTPLAREIFSPVLRLHEIVVNRSISANSASRSPVAELIGTNY